MIAPTSVRPNGPLYIFVSCMLAAQPAPSRDTAMMAPRLCLMTLLPNGGNRSSAAVRDRNQQISYHAGSKVSLEPRRQAPEIAAAHSYNRLMHKADVVVIGAG